MTKFNAESISFHTVGAPVEPEQPTSHSAYVVSNGMDSSSPHFGVSTP